jgi:hypothetical protein
MGTFARTTKFALAAAAIVAAGTAAQQPTVSVLGDPGDGGGGGCSTDCSNGAFGRGGEASAGKANGTLFRTPSTDFPGESISASGNEHAGRIGVTNTGSASGNFEPEPPGGLRRGHLSGIFGDCSGNLEKKDC